MTDIQARLQKHYQTAINHYGDEAVLGIFLYGSWNYNTNTLNSDVDTKCILIPSLYNLAMAPFEVKHLAVDDEVCECMSIMHMVSNWKKQNINFVETMFTPHCIINPLYKDLWEQEFSLEARERVARYSVKQAIHSMAHQAISTIERKPTDPKAIMNGLRIARTLELVADTSTPYAECIWMKDDVREHRFHEPEPHFVNLILTSLNGYLEDVNNYLDNEAEQLKINEELTSLIMTLIRYRENVLNF